MSASSETSMVSSANLEVSSPVTEHESHTTTAWSVVAVVSLAAFYFVTSLYIASHRLFWIDEMFTVHVSRLPGWATILKALAHGVDSQPPLYYMLVRMPDKLLGYREVGLRLPSALAMVAGLLIVFDCARRLTDSLHGLIALSLLTCSFLPYFGYEARPYALYFMFSALAFWVWNYTGDDSKWGAFLLGAVLCLAVTMHYYATLCIVPYALWEAIHWRPWRRPSRKLIAGSLGVVVPAMVQFPLILSFAHEFSGLSAEAAGPVGHWGSRAPSVWALRTIFSQFFPDGLFLLALLILCVILLGGGSKRVTLQSMSAGEAVGWLFLCIPLVGFVLAVLKTNAFSARYVIGALPGVGVAFACFLWRHFHDPYRFRVGMAALLLLATWGVGEQVTRVRDPEPITQAHQKIIRQFMSVEDSVGKEGKQFILFPYLSFYLDAEYYSQRRPACAALMESDGYMRAIGFHLSDFYPLQFWTFEDLRKHALDTALIEPEPEVLDRLKKAGFQVEVRYPKPLGIVYLH